MEKLKNKKAMKTIGIILGITALALISINKFRVNFSNSEPLGLYYTTNTRNLEKGDRVVIDHNKFEINGIKKEKVFFKPNDVLKSIRGVEGDVITVKNNEIYVNDENFGKILAVGNIEPYFKEGDKIIVPKDKYILLGRSILSYDSRYLGFFDKKDFKNKAVLLYEINKKEYEIYQENVKKELDVKDKLGEILKKVYKSRFKKDIMKIEKKAWNFK